MITPSEDGPDLEPDDPLAVILRPASGYLAPPPGGYEAIRRDASRRRVLRAAAGVGLSCVAAALQARDSQPQPQPQRLGTERRPQRPERLRRHDRADLPRQRLDADTGPAVPGTVRTIDGSGPGRYLGREQHAAVRACPAGSQPVPAGR